MNENDLIKASKKFQKTDKKYPMMSVREYDAPIEWAFKKNKKNFTCVNKNKRYVDSKKIDKKYFNSGNFEIYKKKDLIKKNKFYKFYGYIMPKYRSIDIDNIDDWKIAEALYLNK